MKFSARVQNSPDHLQVRLRVGEKEQTLIIPPRPSGGSSISGGELLFLALATCYCNDFYREAAKRDIKVESVEVEVKETLRRKESLHPMLCIELRSRSMPVRMISVS
jgi:uncharacterized OsmC-like protein